MYIQQFNNGIIITWILHQIIMYCNKVKLVAGKNTITLLPPLLLDEQTDK